MNIINIAENNGVLIRVFSKSIEDEPSCQILQNNSQSAEFTMILIISWKHFRDISPFNIHYRQNEQKVYFNQSLFQTQIYSFM